MSVDTIARLLAMRAKRTAEEANGSGVIISTTSLGFGTNLRANQEVNGSALVDAVIAEAKKGAKVTLQSGDSSYIVTSYTETVINGSIVKSFTCDSASLNSQDMKKVVNGQNPLGLIPYDESFLFIYNSATGKTVSLYTNDNKIYYGSITFNGMDNLGTLGGDWLGCSQEQLMTKFPFNELKIKSCKAYAKDKTTVLGDDLYLEMPNCYYKHTTNADGSLKIEISNVKYDDDFKLYYESEEITKLNIAVYKAYRDENSYMRSVSGQYPAVNTTQATAIDQMPYYKNANGFRRAEYQDYRIRAMYADLVVAYLGDRNTQNKYRGICDYVNSAGSVAGDVGESGKSGSTDSLGLTVVSGEITSFNGVSLGSGKRPFKVLGVENPYGLAWENMYGAVHKDGRVYTYTGSAELTANQLNPSDSNTNYSVTTVQMPQSNGDQKAVADGNGYLFPVSLGGDSSKPNGDYYWYASGWRIFFVGGTWNSGSHAGLSYLNGSNTWGNSNGNIGFRLSFIE